MKTIILAPVIGVILAAVFVDGLGYLAPAQLQVSGAANYAAMQLPSKAVLAGSVSPQSLGSVVVDPSLLAQLAGLILAAVVVAVAISFVTSRRRT